MADKLKMLKVDELRMDELAVFERMSGYSMAELQDIEGEMPTSVVMALCYLTERRVNPKLKREAYQSMTFDQFIRHLYARFEFEASDSNYEVWSVADLKLELGKRGLAKTGKKPELVARLVESDEADDEDPTSAA